jgi:hypothetical protein
MKLVAACVLALVPGVLACGRDTDPESPDPVNVPPGPETVSPPSANDTAPGEMGPDPIQEPTDAGATGVSP